MGTMSNRESWPSLLPGRQIKRQVQADESRDFPGIPVITQTVLRATNGMHEQRLVSGTTTGQSGWS